MKDDGRWAVTVVLPGRMSLAAEVAVKGVRVRVGGAAEAVADGLDWSCRSLPLDERGIDETRQQPNSDIPKDQC